MGLAKDLRSAANLYLQKKYPVSLIHFVTNRCNARCPFCFIDFGDEKTQRESGEMTLEEVRRLTGKLGPSLQNVNLTGGEPFLREDLVDIARAYFANAGLGSMHITSNGSFPDRVESLARAISGEFPGKQLFFSFSIDSFPAEHEKIRRLPGLFEKALESYRAAKGFGPRVSASITLTCSQQNYQVINRVYDELRDKHGVTCFAAAIVRDEGVYKVPAAHKNGILLAYKELTGKILSDLASGRTQGFDTGTLRGQLVNAKSELQYKIIGEDYLEPRFRSYCPAGSIFGVIGADATVHPCEILERPLGNLRDYDFDFLALWRSAKAAETKDFIRESKCHCHWECAWTYNILSNPGYQLPLWKNVARARLGGGK